MSADDFPLALAAGSGGGGGGGGAGAGAGAGAEKPMSGVYAPIRFLVNKWSVDDLGVDCFLQKVESNLLPDLVDHAVDNQR